MSLGTTLAASARYAANYAVDMAKDVTPAMFARLATSGGKPVQSNHPAWVYGHCAFYFSSIIELTGGTLKPAHRPAGYEDLFKNGSTCLDDPNGTIYPPMAELIAYYNANLNDAVAALTSASDETLNAPHLKDGQPHPYFPTKGALAGFLCCPHPLNHLGQISAWRRFMGLGSAR